ncbi:MAG: deoxyribodipyrimidine photo-lyase [Verrucomicrobiota bacterium]
MTTAIHWFRRDLRLSDNPSLYHALNEHDTVLPIFIFDPKILKAKDVGIPRIAYLLEALASLKKNLQYIGAELFILKGEPVQQLSGLFKANRITALYYNKDYEPYALERDNIVNQLCQKKEISCKVFEDLCIYPPNTILKKDGSPYTVFTPFSKALRQLTPPKTLPRPQSIKLPQKTQTSLKSSIPSLDELELRLEIPMISSGEKAANDALKSFLKKNIFHYASKRNSPFEDTTSRLSPHLRFGTISPRFIYLKVITLKNQSSNYPSQIHELDTFVSELIWRDFYKNILYHFPHVASGCYRPEYDRIPWQNDTRLFKKWCHGQTGFPIVDAAMRQLNQTGWMHNRLRMIVASFLCKDLHIDWKWGEKYFMQKLYDGDLAANNGGWQWTAGTGTDAAPYFRIFNPTSQAEKFDPEGHFIKKYVPESNSLDYPPPVVDHSQSRQKTLLLYKEAKGS